MAPRGFRALRLGEPAHPWPLGNPAAARLILTTAGGQMARFGTRRPPLACPFTCCMLCLPAGPRRQTVPCEKISRCASC